MLHERNPTNKSRTECGLDVYKYSTRTGAQVAYGKGSAHVGCAICLRNRALRKERLDARDRVKEKEDAKIASLLLKHA